MNSKRKYKRGICRTLIVVMMVSMMGGVYPMMRENQACAFTRTMNVNDWLEQCRMVAIKVSNEKAKYHGDPGSPTKKYDKNFNRKHLTKIHRRVQLNCADYASWCLQRYKVLPVGQKFWVQGQSIEGKDEKKVRKNKKFQQIKIAKKGVYASTLVKRKGTKSLKKGDLVSVVKKNGKGHHIQIYAGREEGTGKMLWYMVNNGSICDKNGYLKLSRMLRTVNGQYNGNPRVAMILRIKGLNYTEKFKVTTSHGARGTIAGSRWVKWGKDAEFAVTPEEGYEIAGATVNGKAIEFDPSADSVTVKNVRKTSRVRVEFREAPPTEVPDETVEQTPEGGNLNPEEKE